MNEKTELLPCPFCGEPARVFTGNTTGIACSNDQCVIYTDTPLPFNDHGHFESAVAAWNRRAASPSSKSTKEAPTDTERLDWLEKHFTDVHGVYVDASHTVLPFAVDCEEDTMGDASSGRIRAAIDAALASSSIKEDGERAA